LPGPIIWHNTSYPLNFVIGGVTTNSVGLVTKALSFEYIFSISAKVPLAVTMFAPITRKPTDAQIDKAQEVKEAWLGATEILTKYSACIFKSDHFSVGAKFLGFHGTKY